MEKAITVNDDVYEIDRLLAKGKGGYSYLAKAGEISVVLKQIHYEPCEYYQFEANKLNSEIRDYKTLSGIGIPMPNLLSFNQEEQYLIKEYIPGDTLAQIVADGRLSDDHIAQIIEMCKKLYPNNLNIDYFPTNFVENRGLLYYVDYECSQYSDEWNFENWGIWFLANRKGMKDYLNTGSHSAILDDGKPIKNGFEDIITHWLG